MAKCRLASLVAGVIGALLMLAAPAAAAVKADQPFQSFPVARVDGSTIRASMVRPAGNRLPVILMLQGSNCGSERAAFATLTRQWRERRVLLYIPKPGSVSEDDTCGPEYLARNGVDQRLQDILRVVQRLRTESWWNHELYVIGTSEGGLMAGLTAAYVPETRRVTILSFGGALTMGEWWPEAAYAGVLKETGSPAKADAERAEVLQAFAQARNMPRSLETFGGPTNTLAWWASIIDVRLQVALLDVQIPILLVHGQRDVFAPVEGARGVRRAFQSAGKANLTYREYPDMDHAFSAPDGTSSLERVTKDALEWLLGPASRSSRE